MILGYAFRGSNSFTLISSSNRVSLIGKNFSSPLGANYFLEEINSLKSKSHFGRALLAKKAKKKVTEVVSLSNSGS